MSRPSQLSRLSLSAESLGAAVLPPRPVLLGPWRVRIGSPRTGGPTAMRTVSTESVAAGQERIEEWPASVREALGELAGAAKEGLLALSVGVGLGVLHELMEA